MKKITDSDNTNSNLFFNNIRLSTLLSAGVVGFSFSVWMGAQYRLQKYLVTSITLPPRKKESKTPAYFKLPYEEVVFPSLDGLKLHGWYLPARQSKAALLLVHGYHQSKNFTLSLAEWLGQAGYSLLMFDLRAHGKSEGGRGSSLGYMERLDLHGAVKFLQTRGESQIGVIGFSMGAAASIIAASENPDIRAIIADSPYILPEQPLSYLLKQRHKLSEGVAVLIARFAIKAIARHHGASPDKANISHYMAALAPRPLMLIHGGADTLIPASHSEALFKLAKGRKQLWIQPGISHIRMHSSMPEEYRRRVLEFLDGVDWSVGAAYEQLPDRLAI